MKAIETVLPEPAEEEFLTGLLRGHRFRLCRSADDIRAMVEVRRQVYVDGNGYDVPVPDAYDAWSWHVLAEDVERGVACGSVRITPRDAGPLEAEEYFCLPPALRGPGILEISRFAILPPYRKGKTFLPIVSLGLFAVVRRVLDAVNARHMVICCKPERLWTFEWLLFHRTGLRARYEKLGGTEHELLSAEVGRATKEVLSHPFHCFFDGHEFAEVERPEPMPPLGLLDAFALPTDGRRNRAWQKAVA